MRGSTFSTELYRKAFRAQVAADPRHFPWHRAIRLLDKKLPLKALEHLRSCVSELLNRAWAQHDFGMDAEAAVQAVA